MKKRIPPIFRYLFLTAFVFILIAYLCSVLAPYLDPAAFWMIAITGFLFPYLALLLIGILVGLIIRKKKAAWAVGLLVLAGWPGFQKTWPIRFSTSFDMEKSPGVVRVLNWNVARWDEPNRAQKGGQTFRPLMLDYIQSQGADVLCLQEFYEFYGRAGLFESNIKALADRGYPYYYFYPSSAIWEGQLKFGTAIFSRFPIVDSVAYPNVPGEHSEGLIYADVKAPGGILRVFSTHFESIGYRGEGWGPGGWGGRLKAAYQQRAQQARETGAIIRKSPYPVILAGDIADVPPSYAYFTLRKDLKDAHVERGAGGGRTTRTPSFPGIRIDYLFYSNNLIINQYKAEKLPYSDHFPLVGDFRF